MTQPGKTMGPLLATVLAGLVAVVLGVTVAPPAGAGAAEFVTTVPPSVSGEARFGEELVADPGEWTQSGLTYSYRWLRDGEPVRGARAQTYTLGGHDLGHRLAVRVRATDAEGRSGYATSGQTSRVTRADLANRARPEVGGEARWTHTLTADEGRWSATPQRYRYRWFQGQAQIPGATDRRYVIAPGDVGRRVRVEVTAYADGHRPATARSAAVRVRHRVDLRRTVTYHVETRGRITASLAKFGRLAQQTYDDPRGWRAKGVHFRRVERGGQFTLVLAEARTVPSFSSECSAEWSCRVGRFVIINQTRWQHASPAWNQARLPLRDYRTMVVNHETGHWLGKGHASCPRPGALAPVMMQQSKGRDGCRFNPWPTAAELNGG